MPRLPAPKHPLFALRNQQLLEGYKAGASRAYLALRFQISTKRVGNIIQEYKAWRGGRYSRSTTNRISSRLAVRIIRDYKSLTQKELSQKYHFDIRTIRRFLKRQHLGRRPGRRVL